jgi:CBS domain-containing protein
LLVKDSPAEAAMADQGNRHKSVLASIMKTDVFTLPPTATVEEAMRLFVEKGISAAPLVDTTGKPVGFISDGDILHRLSARNESYLDPIALISQNRFDDEEYEDKLKRLMGMQVDEIGVSHAICVNIHADLEEVCRVLSEYHLKKVPVLENGAIVGVINRSDVTKYSMAKYLELTI